MQMKKNNQSIPLSLCGAFFAATLISQIAVAADAGGIQRDIENLNNPKLSPPVPPKEQETTEPNGNNNVAVTVTTFKITGATYFSDAELQAHVANYIGKTLDLSALNQVTKSISQFYQANGWLAKVYLPPQDIQDGVVTIAITEAQLGEVHLDSSLAHRMDTSFAVKMLTDAQKSGKPLSTKALERSMLLINDTSGFSGQATLSQGKKSGETDVTLNLADKPLVNGRVWADNYGSRALGKGRLNGQASFNDITGFGDQLLFFGLLSRGLGYLQGGYDFPTTYSGTRMNVRAAITNYDVNGAGLDNLDANGQSHFYRLSISHPFLRSRFTNFIFRSSLASLHSVDKVLGLEVANKSYGALTMGFTADHSDDLGLGGTLWAGASITAGDLDLSGNQDDLVIDRASARTDGRYHKLNLHIGRSQILSDRFTAKALFSAQFSDSNLGGFEKFSLGGPAGVAGFTVGEAAADQGGMFNLEGKYFINQNWSASLLGDAGRVCLYKHTWVGWNANNPNLKNCYAIASVGFGVAYKVKNIDARLRFSQRITGNRGADNKGHDVEGESRKHQLWLQVGFSF